MEKQQSKPRNNILKFLPRAASAIYFQNVPFSPNKDHRKPHAGTKGFSGPILSIIPDEARRKPRNGDGFGTQEPTSPKISCMGQIKHKKKVNGKPAGNRSKNKRVPVPPPEKPVFFTPREGKKVSGRSAMERMFSMSKTAARKSSSELDQKAGNVVDRAPGLGQLKRFSSGREALSGFDWTAEIRKESCGGRKCYSDDEADEEEEEVIIIPASRPMVSCLQARNEVNLWKRRTISPPAPLQVNP